MLQHLCKSIYVIVSIKKNSCTRMFDTISLKELKVMEKGIGDGREGWLRRKRKGGKTRLKG